jgi:uncharacterized protein YbjT (DUF2867 family)
MSFLTNRMNIAIIGASGFIGKNLIKYLLENTSHNIFAISQNSTNIIIDEKYNSRVKKLNADVLDYEQIKYSLSDTDIAYYLVHMMATTDIDNFYKKEEIAAHNTGSALKQSGVKRVIYMSGLGSDKDKLSHHLLSRHNTGDILRKYNNEVIELRASMIIGPGSISFEIVKNLVEKTPIITLPRWSNTKTQPIGLKDALLYLKDSIDIKINNHEIIEIGGPESMSYKEFIKKYVKFRNKKNIVVRIPILPEKIAGIFLNIFTQKEQAQVGRCMLDSFKNEMIVTNNRSRELFPDILPSKIEESFS